LAGNNAIYWRPDRLELLESGGFYLSKTPEESSLDWDATYVWGLIWVCFRVLGAEQRFLHLNTHLDHIGELSRVEGVRLALARLPELRAEHLLVIFTGDFNCDNSPG
jgi:endonuclease/exonuclease/phosphatase family metal-dependent hydrolase